MVAHCPARVLEPHSREAASDEVINELGQFGAAVLLHEVSAAFDGAVRLPLGAGDKGPERFVAASGDRVLVAEATQERLLPGLQRLPCSGVIGTLGAVR